MLLENSLLLQQPLYIGKAENLKKRIYTHLSPSSVLRTRLMSANYNIEKCKLLIIGINSIKNLEYRDDELENDDYEDEVSNTDSERLTEDILSRLFLPSFSINYG